jgi:hypothetical protein
MQDRPTSNYLVGLLFESPPVLDGERLLAALKERHPAMIRTGDLQYLLGPEAPEWEGIQLPVSHWAVLPVVAPPDPARLVDAAGHTWDWPEAKQVLQRCRYKLLAGDFMAVLPAPRIRLRLLHGFLRAVVQLAKPLAIEWLASERFVHPGRYLEAGDDEAFALAALNVRMFNVGDGGEDEMLMDTRGMAELGLPDVQCHFSKLPPSQVAVSLASTAHYLLHQGDVIKDGDTVDGVEGEVWRFRHEKSLMAPVREVLDLSPQASPRGVSIEDARVVLETIAEVKGAVSPELLARTLDPATSDRERATLLQQAFSWSTAGEP